MPVEPAHDHPDCLVAYCSVCRRALAAWEDVGCEECHADLCGNASCQRGHVCGDLGDPENGAPQNSPEKKLDKVWRKSDNSGVTGPA